MATDTKQPAQTKDPQFPAPIAEPGDGFIPLSSNRLIYKPDLCGTHPVRGFLLARLEMPPVGGDRDWAGYVVRLTAPTVGVDREGNKQPLQRGEEILIPETHVLASDPKIQVIAKSPDYTAEIWLKPSRKMKIGGGQELWLYDARMSKPRKRDDEEKMFNLGAAIGAPQLPASNGQAQGAAANAPF